MNYVSTELIKSLREKKQMTQKQLAQILSVSDKTVSKWETGKGLPDISIIEDLAKALQVSVAELMTGEYRVNENPSGNMRKTVFYVCPVCGNIVTAVGKGSFSCCGILLPELEIEEVGEDHRHQLLIEQDGSEYYVTMQHDMMKNHYISFITYVTSDGVEMRKLYPEQSIEVRFQKRGSGYLYAYCNRHGLFRVRI